MLDPETQAEVHRLYTNEARPIGTIARELKLHHWTVERAIREPIESRPSPVRGTIFDDLNAQARNWCLGRAAGRPWPDDRFRTDDDATGDDVSGQSDYSGDLAWPVRTLRCSGHSL